MASTKTYTFNSDNASDFTYDTAKVQLDSSSGCLLLQDYPSQTFQETFDSDTGFTYDSDLVEFSGGQIQQKAQLYNADTLSWATYTSSVNLTYATGTSTGTASGGAAIVGNRLDLTGGSGKQVTYNGTNNINLQKGCLRVKFTPNYNNAPAAQMIIFQAKDTANNSRLIIRHDTSNSLAALFYDTSSSLVGSVSFSNPATSGVTQVYELNWDWTGGTRNGFLDGVLKGSYSGTATMGTPDEFIVGVSSNIDCYIEDLIFFDEIQNTITGFDPAYTLSDTPYNEAYVKSPVESANGSPDGKLQSVDDWTVTGTDHLRFTFNDFTNDIAYFYDTTLCTWRPSDTTFEQGNTSAELLTYLPLFPFPDNNIQFQYGIILRASDVQENIQTLDIAYTHQIYLTTSPTVSIANASRIYTEGITNFVATEDVSKANTSVKFIMVSDGTKYYHDGGDWVASNGTVAQSNTEAEVLANIADFISDREQFGIDVFLTTSDGLYSPCIQTITITHDAALADPSQLPTLIDINGYIYDNNGAVASQEIRVRPYQAGFTNPTATAGGVFHIYDWSTLATTVSDGFFSGGVYRQPDNKYWEFKIGSQRYYTQLPDQDAVDFSSLTLTTVTE